VPGFPSHPHRGFETVTYLLDGHMLHEDHLGNRGNLKSGGVQWMTAGRGIIHSEMPQQENGRMRGFQLWINLPAKDKMVAPQYQEFGPDRIPVARPASGVTVRIIAGVVAGQSGPVAQPATDPTYLDVELQPGSSFRHELPDGHAAFVYVFEGSATVGQGAQARVLQTHELAVLGDGAAAQIDGPAPGAGVVAARAILVAGRTLREPVARYGPFVMNTREELRQAFEDFEKGRI
jgi:redox-sensitive bicupin YhaK (pirin superfamily)